MAYRSRLAAVRIVAGLEGVHIGCSYSAARTCRLFGVVCAALVAAGIGCKHSVAHRRIDLAVVDGRVAGEDYVLLSAALVVRTQAQEMALRVADLEHGKLRFEDGDHRLAALTADMR